ncbi:MAG: tetratricopeptide repeat protein [Bacteroidales bacterium]|nr:tetratricopeptide repeat protein [Bacteroidales bacterium]
MLFLYVLLSINFDMNRNLIYIILSLAILLPASLSGQSVREGAESANMIITAVERYNERDIDGAKKILQQIIAEDSENDAAWYYMALCAIAGNDVEMAEQGFRMASELDPDNFWYRYRLARLYSMTSRPELTVDMYEKLLEDFPKKSDLYFDLVEMYAAQREYQKALDTLKEIETVFGMTESIAMYRFNLLRMLDKQEEAFKSLEEYNKEYSSPYVLSTLADYQMSMYNDSTALAYYDEALDLAPDYAPALLGKAETLRLTRKYEEYFDILDRYVSGMDSPAAAKSDYLMAVVQRTDPKFINSFRPQLDSVIDKAVGLHPKDSLMLQTAAVYYYSTDRKDLAKKHFKANVEAWPESFASAANYIEFLMYAEEWEDLSKEGRAAFDKFPQETAFLEMASVGDYNLEAYDKVLDICTKVLEVAPKDSSKTLRAWSTMGDIYHQLGDDKKAYKAYDKALKINPDYIYVLNNYAYYLSVEGKKLKKAYNMSKRTIEAEPDNATYLDTFGWILYLQGKPLEAKPFFKHAMLYGGKDSVVIMDHYAEVLYALKEYDLAMVYWNMALKKNAGDVPDLEERVELRKQSMKK